MLSLSYLFWRRLAMVGCGRIALIDCINGNKEGLFVVVEVFIGFIRDTGGPCLLWSGG